ncbi:3-hydroxyacyl-CoA dehydrogenase family protein [Marininema halotolerans]|uniref:3-hydroxybutyryl-CoA dehydrogenase n=1 Tax=Marininema halotolerans TaxID=1155944 RepID=A0A1I6UJP2_9BACL|nr:3-hydroxyacyl-CoA dehydrogenase NAD-binding domain-containing protein [Marininema halotolerans]SFT01648.1 3-hydroxybutyryl-CoA dehydrogenase [Marininema halotolerans]
MNTAETYAILGAGTMGGGIAQFLASAGCDILLYDLDEKALAKGLESIRTRLLRQEKKGTIRSEERKAIIDRIHPVTDLTRLSVVTGVIEAVLERIDVKQELFKAVEPIVGDQTWLATNTSSLSVTEIAGALRLPQRMLGLHFFNPAPIMPLVEVVQGERTNPKVLSKVAEWIQCLGKEAVTVKDRPGFLVNRVARPFHNEAYRLVGDGVAEKSQVDRILREAGFPMGPFELQDLIGIDINYAASMAVYEGFSHDPRFRPHPSQRQLVTSGALGRKSGRGHYSYDE